MKSNNSLLLLIILQFSFQHAADLKISEEFCPQPNEQLVNRIKKVTNVLINPRLRDEDKIKLLEKNFNKRDIITFDVLFKMFQRAISFGGNYGRFKCLLIGYPNFAKIHSIPSLKYPDPDVENKKLFFGDNFVKLENTQPLLLATYYKNIDMIKKLIEKGANINQVGYGLTPILMAALHCNPDKFRVPDLEFCKLIPIFLSAGADLYIADHLDRNFLWYVENDDNIKKIYDQFLFDKKQAILNIAIEQST